MSSQNVAVIKGLYGSFASGDMPGVLGCLHDNIVWNEAQDFVYADQSPYVGVHAVVHGLFMRFGTEWDGFASVPKEYLDAGETVVVLGRYKGTYKATGKALDAEMVHVWRMKEGKVAEFQQYVNTLAVARVTGHSPNEKS